MQSIVSALQQDALHDNSSLTNLLMKALFVARKLKIKEFVAWIKNELEGYKILDEIPSYRKSYCQIRIQSPHYGWQPILFEDREKENALTNVSITQPITEIERLRCLSNGEITLTLPSNLIIHLQKSMDTCFPISRFIPQTAIDKICESVRKIVLEWALTLEEQGILGENMSFTEEEKTKANNNQQINIHNFQGVFGNIINSDAKQYLNLSVQENILQDLFTELKKIGIEQQDLDGLVQAIKSDSLPQSCNGFGEKISGWINAIVSKAATGAGNISTTVLTDILKKYIYSYYGLK